MCSRNLRLAFVIDDFGNNDRSNYTHCLFFFFLFKNLSQKWTAKNGLNQEACFTIKHRIKKKENLKFEKLNQKSLSFCFSRERHTENIYTWNKNLIFPEKENLIHLMHSRIFI